MKSKVNTSTSTKLIAKERTNTSPRLQVVNRFILKYLRESNDISYTNVDEMKCKTVALLFTRLAELHHFDIPATFDICHGIIFGCPSNSIAAIIGSVSNGIFNCIRAYIVYIDSNTGNMQIMVKGRRQINFNTLHLMKEKCAVDGLLRLSI